MPPDRHFDSGFGATADSFHSAAEVLDSGEHKCGLGLSSSKLPVMYLYRHANELYLKSILTILHRRFSSGFPQVRQNDFPLIAVNGKSLPVFTVHSISHLYRQIHTLLEANSKQIRSIGKTDWSTVLNGVDELIKLIDDTDKTSTIFRYPMTRDPLNDAKKSSFKPISQDAAVAEAHCRTNQKMPGVKILALKNEHDEITETFIHDENPMAEVAEALKQLVGVLSCTQFGMLREFMNP